MLDRIRLDANVSMIMANMVTARKCFQCQDGGHASLVDCAGLKSPCLCARKDRLHDGFEAKVMVPNVGMCMCCFSSDNTTFRVTKIYITHVT
jgi:hypothetical protein